MAGYTLPEWLKPARAGAEAELVSNLRSDRRSLSPACRGCSERERTVHKSRKQFTLQS